MNSRRWLSRAAVISGVVGVVLLIACKRRELVAGAGVVTKEEIAVRLAVGASRWRLVRQLLTESVLLARWVGPLGFFLRSGSKTGSCS